ncbi:MAG: AAA family ATPase [Tannerellaceae bacterium]|jgi:replicative DNA helicase|nr:AAA family ATPase [Tannerellaceae bacterium]
MDKLLPCDINAEKVVLGTIMGDRNALSDVWEILSPETFYDPFHKEIYQAILEISKRGDRPDVVMVLNELAKSGKKPDAFRLSEISSSYTFDLYQHAALIHDKAKRREFVSIAMSLNNSALDESNDIVDILAEVEDRLKNLFATSSDNIHTINEAIKGVKEQINRNHSDGNRLTGTPTGFSQFDSKSGGLQKSDLIVIAADTSQGKTSLAVTIALSAAQHGSAVAMYSMEMKKEQIAARMMSVESGVPANTILYSKLTDEQFDSIDRGLARLYDKPVYFDDRSTSNIDTILASIRTLKAKYNIDGAIVDYLQILNVNMKGANKEAQMGEVARKLKNLAKELDIWIMALSQLNRDSTNTAPSLARLRDSGQIGEAADVVILIYRPEVYKRSFPEPFHNANVTNTALIDVAKGRNIGLLKFLCGFDKKTTKFYELGESSIPYTTKEEQPF